MSLCSLGNKHPLSCNSPASTKTIFLQETNHVSTCFRTEMVPVSVTDLVFPFLLALTDKYYQ